MGHLFVHANRLMSETRNNTRKMTKRILAIPTAAPAIPVNPNTPAISAIIRKITVQPSINLFLDVFLHEAYQLFFERNGVF